ncbi:hypothetical protein BD324DRAFT_619463 [Kockovaella imperatae]|uniref:Mediator complex subunit 16 n=1 Tax=Kockovaella imperatae TaxID=4999 RepID=A0A1Y1UMY4_9TREE|nr:hypothetical protein BD324DRAFT_619463 [Kockovaella imperatae]ORX39379.1 hypothetical protein BD324DRAFT_619463 [Kockovaella imperatae]
MMDPAESSKAGLQRMRRLAAAPPTIKDARHLITSHLVYPSPSGFLITPIYDSYPPRPIPFPPIMSPVKFLWQHGDWITTYHPNIVGEGGQLGIYPKGILSPTMVPANVLGLNHATLALDKEPIEVLPLYTSGDGPPSWRPEHGPVLLVLTTKALLLVHPSSQAYKYTSTMIQCPIHMRWRASVGEQVPVDSGYAIERGWMGEAGDAAWVATESEGELRMLRAEVGMSRDDTWYLEVTPLPALPVRGLQGVVFMPFEDGVEAVVIQPRAAHTYTIQRQEAELVNSFAELSEATSQVSWDWFVSGSRTASLPGIIEAIQVGPNFIVVLSTDDGVMLAQMDRLWTIQSKVDLGPRRVDGIMCSQGALGGTLGLVGIHDGREILLVPFPLQEDLASSAYDSILSAINDGSDWSDVVRAAFASRKPNLARDILQLARLDADHLLQLQVAVFGHSHQNQLRDVSAEMLRLRQASGLFTLAAQFEKIIKFDCVWPLVTVAEWSFCTLSSIFRDVILKDAVRSLHVLVPHARSTILVLLSQLDAFSSYVAGLDHPIPQPQTRYMPTSLSGDPRATILAKDRMRNLASSHGVEIERWGKELQAIHMRPTEEESLFLQPELVPVRLKALTLPAPSSLFLNESESQIYDAVTFAPIAGDVGLICDRCESRTVASFGVTGGDSIWEKWVKDREESCGCGGCWVRGR